MKEAAASRPPYRVFRLHRQDGCVMLLREPHEMRDAFRFHERTHAVVY